MLRKTKALAALSTSILLLAVATLLDKVSAYLKVGSKSIAVIGQIAVSNEVDPVKIKSAD